MILRLVSFLVLSSILQLTVEAQLPQQFSSFKFDGPSADEISPIPDSPDRDKIIQLQQNAEDLKVDYWSSPYPSYRWHQIMMEVSRTYKGHKNGGRVAILHLAIYDAMVATDKFTSQDMAPFQEFERVDLIGRSTAYQSGVCQWSVAAGAAHQVISFYFPNRQDDLDKLLSEFQEARLATGLQYSFEIQRGIEIGRSVANEYINYAKSDRTDQVWTGTIPEIDTLWTGNPGKWDPMKRQWKPLTLESADQFRPSPPPTDWTADMEELRAFNRDNETSEIAWKWKSAPVWDDMVERKILEYQLRPMEASFANAVFHAARFDGIIAAWDGKYHYMGIRPFQYDPDFKPILVETPNFPGYPAGHTTVAGSLSTVLSYLFPADSSLFREMAVECSESRFEGGVHFRTDNEVGLEVGAEVGSWLWQAFTR